jgi:polyphosphate kinase 2
LTRLGPVCPCFANTVAGWAGLPQRRRGQAIAKNEPYEVVLDETKATEAVQEAWAKAARNSKLRKPPKDWKYVDELAYLQFELIELQEWVRLNGLKVLILFEGRDAAGKGGAIKRISGPLNPRICRVVALGTPTERERGPWYVQRYVAQLPSKGEIVLMDRSWYNRAGVERVMGFCTDEEYKEFLRATPKFEKMLVRSGIQLVKFWFSVNDEEQEKRFMERVKNPFKRWKLSPMDLESRKRWVDYSRAKDTMFEHTDRDETPWYVVNADNKKRARLNCIRHLLDTLPYKDMRVVEIEILPRQEDTCYQRPKQSTQRFVAEVY